MSTNNDLHPKLNKVKIVLPDGTYMHSMSAYNKSDTISVDVDFKKHTAWTGGLTQLNTNADQVANYNKKFGSLGLFGKKSN